MAQLLAAARVDAAALPGAVTGTLFVPSDAALGGLLGALGVSDAKALQQQPQLADLIVAYHFMPGCARQIGPLAHRGLGAGLLHGGGGAAGRCHTADAHTAGAARLPNTPAVCAGMRSRAKLMCHAAPALACQVSAVCRTRDVCGAAPRRCGSCHGKHCSRASPVAICWVAPIAGDANYALRFTRDALGAASVQDVQGNRVPLAKDILRMRNLVVVPIDAALMSGAPSCVRD
jgi:hypothetical protein